MYLFAFRGLITCTLAIYLLRCLCAGVCHGDNAIVSASIRTLRTLYQSGRAPSSAVFQEEMVARQLVQLVSSSSPLIGQCAAAILAKACQVRGKTGMWQSLHFSSSFSF